MAGASRDSSPIGAAPLTPGSVVDRDIVVPGEQGGHRDDAGCYTRAATGDEATVRGGGSKDATRENCLPRHWMHQFLVPALPSAIRNHLCTATVTSAAFTTTVTSYDQVYLPSHSDLRHAKRWGTLDYRTGSFWLRDVGRGVGRDGAQSLSGSDTYNPLIYDYGLQPMAIVDLSTYPEIRARLTPQ